MKNTHHDLLNHWFEMFEKQIINTFITQPLPFLYSAHIHQIEIWVVSGRKMETHY